MHSDGVSRDASLEIAPVYLVWDGEMMIDAPIKTVWRGILDYASWQNIPIVQHISGEPGAEGEVVLLKKELTGFEFPPYWATVLTIGFC